MSRTPRNCQLAERIFCTDLQRPFMSAYNIFPKERFIEVAYPFNQRTGTDFNNKKAKTVTLDIRFNARYSERK